ncbi:unnamed protein product, partial [Mesorhabditis belari]|uniref:Methylmalonic aciduria and homocystinuria type D protein, mitochondrial n=1 Tax=Mesorhabditis belari TaxID=2138241 RepID=A0AAF3EAE8_9BILA
MKRYVVNTHLGALRLRFFSTALTQHPMAVFVGEEQKIQRNSLLGPSPQFPLPGNVCDSKTFNADSTVENPSQSKTSSVRTTSVQTILNQGQQYAAADQAYLYKQAESVELDGMDDVRVEIKAQKCPRLLQRDLKSLFPHMNLTQASVNVINISQQSSTDQSAWSTQMEAERDKLTVNFINTANNICSALEKLGYWADFIDPSSGRPYRGQFTNATLFETDEAFQQLGFQIEDLGCCRVLKHIKWGSHAFVGTIFTDAPIESEIMKQLLDEKNDSDGINS